MALAEDLNPGEYDAFISYSRRDREFAAALEKRLEAYAPPKGLAVPRRRLKIFRDEGDLTGTEYFRSIERHLRGAAKLIVVCTPATRKSEYVNDEIRRFAEARGAQHIIPVLLAGIPNNEATPEQSAEQAFPDALCEALRMPLATSYLGFAGGKDKVHKGDFEGSWYTLLANLYEVSREEIEQRDRKRQQRRRKVAAAVAATVIVSLATLAVIAWWQKGVADEQRNVALRGLSRYLASEAQDRYDRDPQTGLLLAIEAVRVTRDADGYVTPAAEQAIHRGLPAIGGQPLGAHREGLVAAAFSPDGRRVGTIGRDGIAKVWNIEAIDETPYSLSIQPSTPTQMAFSPDGQWLAVGGEDPAFAGLWRIDTAGGEVLPLGQPVERVSVLRFSPDGSRLVMGSQSAQLQVWNLENPRTGPITLTGHQPYRDYRGQLQGIKGADFGPTGRWLVTTGWDDKALLWDLDTAEPAPQVLLAEDSHWKPAHFSRDGRWLALPVGSDGSAWKDRLAAWRLDGEAPVRVDLADDGLAAVTDFGDPTILGFHAERPLLAATSQSHVVIWELGGDPPQRYEFAAQAAALSDDGQWLATSEKDEVGGRIRHRVFIRNLANLEDSPARLTSLDESVKRLTLSPDGRHLAVADGQDRIRLIRNDPNARFPMTWVLSGHEGRVETEAFSADGRWLLTAARWGDRSARLWRVNNPSTDPVRITGVKRTPELEYKTRFGGGGGQPVGGLPNAMAFDPLNRWLAIPGERGAAIVVSLSGPTAAPHILGGHTRDVTAIAFAPDGAWLATAEWNYAVRLWRPPDFERPAAEFSTADTPEMSSVSALAVDSQGNQMATGGRSGKVVLWDVKRPQEAPRMIDAHKEWITALAFNPDGTRLITAAEEGEAKLWDIGLQQLRPVALEGHRDTIARALFSADDRWIVTAGMDALVNVWSSSQPDLPPTTLRGHSDRISSLALGSGSRWLVTGSLDHTVRVWDMQALDSPSRLLGRLQAPVNAVAISVDRNWIAAADLAGRVHVWRRAEPNRPPTVLPAVDTSHPDDDEAGMPWALGFSPDGRWLAVLAGGEVRIWRMRIEEQLQLACDLVGRNLSYDAWETFLAGIPYRLSCPGLGLHPDFIVAAERLASQGEVDRATERFQVAKTIDSTLALDPRGRAVELAVRGHLEQGRSLARKGRLDAALAELRNVGRLDPNRDFDPQAEVNRVSEAWNLREKAIALAGSGKVEAAVEVFKQALALDPSLDLDPAVEARRLNAPRIKKEGDRLARAGQLDAAAAMYARALEDGLESGLDPTSEARRVRASALVNEARDIARGGELAQAQETFQRALALNPLLRLDPAAEARKFFAKQRLEQGERFYRQGQLAESVSAYREAAELDSDTRISAFILNEICWNGVKQDLAGDVLWACNQAVAREPENGSFRDSRGIARVLTGDIAGAIEDFEAFIDLGSEYDRSAEAIAVRQRWIAGLRTGQRPSTFAGLEALGNSR